ncbi:IS1595 family transposase [Arthrobacter sp. 24S4-2]|uniref:IS1595 family transposase n=1 Tax=Arthrobacter sp. 24S4-2 TaxID=2575374 RepID=UPI0010C7AD71|nr:IS1595 family transposase [Arthrobacter sp. 24S4-2]QCO98123.1 IS1595 family transposase [Arthrobacter sp. 24S4-2]QCO98413.1 IS1595 family transposase [Arthrobacter sp. 24S4-2]QCP00074.1 IS1595 family transposase [Arthrobacter sp. 24S4-2]
MSRPDFPRTILEFQARFGDEKACLDYLAECRWPDGYVCPRCQGRYAWPLAARGLWECAACRYQVSLTAGTVLHKTHTALHLWFWAAYLMTTGTPGISARQLQRQLGLSRYETAWTMLHKLRRAMVNPERTLLTGEVEVDECEVGGPEIGRRGGRSLTARATQVVVAVEVRGQGSGRVRMKVIHDASGDTLTGFVMDTVAPGAIVHTDGWMGYAPLAKKGYTHRPRSQRAAKKAGDTDPVLPRVHRAISNLKTWLRGTHRSVGNEHLQVYLDEFTFRYNRRGTPMAAFQSLLGLGTTQAPTTYRQITAHDPGSDPVT